MFLRRSRGYVPASLPLPGGTPRAAARLRRRAEEHLLPGEGARAWVCHHIGDLENYETLRSFTEGIEHFERLFAVDPRVVAHDLHPEYLSTKYALERDGVELIGVQHHHAHLAACLAEHGERGPPSARSSTGPATAADGTMWGGELLGGDIAEFGRAGSSLPVRLPGGARAIREPWRMACAWLAPLGAQAPIRPRSRGRSTSAAGTGARARARRRQLAAHDQRRPAVRRRRRALRAARGVNYEGQAAIELEAACDRASTGAIR